MTGFVIAFWATPTMSVGHLFFAAMTTAYILVAVQLEERDLVTFHGDEYRKYQRQVGMLIPRLNRSKST
jgi:protein-S-isoprenylcysteine O-methyltransferase Ste14